jgi:hypothetical protein
MRSYSLSVSKWSLLLEGQISESLNELPNYPSGVESNQGPVRLALGPGKELKLLLPIGRYEKLLSVNLSNALSLEDREYESEGRFLRFIELTNHSRDLNGVFAEVCDAILLRIEEGHRCMDALVAVLNEFKALLLPGVIKEATLERIVGLLGEMLILERLLLASPWLSVECWQGPTGARHDFSLGNLAIEVKSTTRVGNTTTRISAIDQLLPPVDGELLLVHILLEQVEDGELTIGSVFERIKPLCSDVMIVRALMFAAGCPDPLSKDWNRLGFRKEIKTGYLIGNGFPSVIPACFIGGDVPAGVSGITYDLDLAAAERWKLDDITLAQWIDNFGGNQ